ncbi:MAG: XRE family transcriptional regulator [Mogibacterium sp.]|nr:XRE family transcriptional regulator [Mogibacterium sp.]
MLAAARTMEQVSQEELANRVGTRKSNISRIERGAQNLTVDYVAALSEALGKEAAFVLREPAVDYGKDTCYSLKLFDEELLRFRLIRGLTLHAEVLSVSEARRDLLPMGLEVSEEGILRWLRERVIPANRDLVGQILAGLGLNINDLKGIIDVSMGLSLNDSYWVPQVEFEGRFAEYDLYENEFSEALSLIAYTGGRYETGGFRTSPELTTGGALRKAWRFSRAKGIWLYKGGSEGFANSGNEPYCEFYACQVAERMGLHAVHYELERWKGILASKCRLFTDLHTAYVPIGSVVREGGIEACLDYYRALGDDFYQELVSMLVFDAVIVNEDRHFGNFGLLRDSHTGEILSPAPIFDNGLSLLCYAMKDDFADLDAYIRTRTNPYGPGQDHLSLCRKLIGPRQKRELRRLIGFRFAESDVSNLPTWRLRALEEMIRDRVRILLEY